MSLTGLSAIVFIAFTLVPIVSASEYQPVETSAGNPDMNGVWQALGAAHWNIEDHAAHEGAILKAGALGASPAGVGVVGEGQIPYQQWAEEKRNRNFQNRADLDPAVKCFMPGIPRATYQPFPFQIIQTPDFILMAYEFAGASRTIYLNEPDLKAPINSWMGHSIGHWEGRTLVVDVTDQVPQTWLDRAGNFHSDALKVTERFTLISPYHLQYDVTIEDTAVYTKPWHMTMPLYKHMEKDARLLEFKCIEFVEELMYGHLSKKEDL